MNEDERGLVDFKRGPVESAFKSLDNKSDDFENICWNILYWLENAFDGLSILSANT